jgi:hypothetical protein
MGRSIFNAKRKDDVGMLFSNFGPMASGFVSAVVANGVIATVCLAIAALVISIGEWKIRLGLLPRFKSLAGRRMRGIDIVRYR